jgi:hypothetical protein
MRKQGTARELHDMMAFVVARQLDADEVIQMG